MTLALGLSGRQSIQYSAKIVVIFEKNLYSHFLMFNDKIVFTKSRSMRSLSKCDHSRRYRVELVARGGFPRQVSWPVVDL